MEREREPYGIRIEWFIGGIVSAGFGIFLLIVKSLPDPAALTIGAFFLLTGIYRIWRYMDLFSGIQMGVSGISLLLLAVPFFGTLARFFLSLGAAALLIHGLFQIVRYMRLR